MTRTSRGNKVRRTLVSAGPTREYIDPVRFLSNASSGKMGFAIARSAARCGDEVTLVAGPVALRTPPGVKRIDVETAREMQAALRERFRASDRLFMCAAVADWRPRRRLAGKWRKKDDGLRTARVELMRNPDILAALAKHKGGRLVIGFALETGQGLARARRKLFAKNADYIVLNAAGALGAERTSVTILSRDGHTRRLVNKTKHAVARALVALE